MSSILKMTLVLTGHYAGQTVVLNGHKFTDGKLKVQGNSNEVGGLISYFAAAYQAFPEGSDELAAAQKRNKSAERKKKNGTDKVLEGEGSKSSGARPDESGTVEPSERSGHDGSEAAAAGSGAAEEDSEPEASVEEPLPTDTLSVEVRKALTSLDPTDDNNWTQAGLPKISAIEPAVTSGELSRALITEAWPGYDREKALKEYEPRDKGALADLEADLDL